MVVLGGTSGERAVSLDSGHACIKALKRKGYKVSKFDPKKKPLNSISKKKVDVIFNSLHGRNGEDGVAQSYFEYLGIPYTHSGVISSYNAMNKIVSKKIFKQNKIKSPRYFVLKKRKYDQNKLKKFLKKNRMNFPIVIKPANEGSSIGVKICKDIREFKNFSNYLFKKYLELMVENFVGGQEIQVAVLNSVPLGAIELKPKRKFYDYQAKYNSKAKTKHIIPVNLSKNKFNELMNISLKVHNLLGCRGVTRSDFKYYKNKFYLLEINTQPGMTKLSLVPEICMYKGISFIKLIELLLDDASTDK